MNVVTFFLYAIDKRKAQKHKWRIKESVLLGCTLLLGSIGAFLGINLLHHKNRHWYFQVTWILSLSLHLFLFVLLLKK